MTTTTRRRLAAKRTAPLPRKGQPGARPTLEFKEFAPIETKVVSEEEGIVEALVAVTGNMDDGGDIIEPGAIDFKRRPKVVWSHDLHVLIGKVLDYKELKPGDAKLPADLKAKKCGALWFKVQFDQTDPESWGYFRKIVFHEDIGWSIGYEVDPAAVKVKAGVRHLSHIYVWEGSPTAFGMNMEARTVSAKSAIAGALDGLRLPAGKAAKVEELIVALVGDGDPGRDEKAWAPLAGSYEETEEALRAALYAYGNQVYGERDADNDWWVSVEGTFDDNVVATYRFYGGDQENVTLQFPYVQTGSEVELGEPEEVELQVSVEPVGDEGTGETTTASTGGETVATGTASIPDDLGAKLAAAGEDLKAGRVLSEANATALRQAAEAIQKVLAAATKEDDEDEEKAARVVVPKGTKAAAPAPKPVASTVVVEEGKELVTAADLMDMVAATS